MKIKIGTTEYNLKLVKSGVLKTADEDDIVLGECSNYDMEIRIDGERKLQVKEQTFYHELVHAIFDELGLDRLNEDEGLVNSIGKQIYAFIKNNDTNKIREFLKSDGYGC